ncbi:MAG: HigA family addiction module antidote protein [Anaerolineales bacterium]|nr:HigA family addiction module antidote protein [Anaerolineales bacterium]
MHRTPTHRQPTHPGQILLKEFLEPMQINQQALARSLQVPYQRINEIINGRRGITPSTALRLARFFGTSAELWLNLQQGYDLYRASQMERTDIQKIRPLQQP